MYPIFRMLREMGQARKLPALSVMEFHETPLRCGLLDIDFQMEMNNGRILTLFDLGRVAMFQRVGVIGKMRKLGWYGTIAGSTVRYRRRITLWQKLVMKSRIIGWDDRFTYIEQSLWRGDECCAQAVLRTALTTGKGIIPPTEAMDAFGMAQDRPALPEWVETWAGAEQMRTWPPERG